MNTYSSRLSYARPSRSNHIQLVACALILIAAAVAMSGCGKKEETPSQSQNVALTPFDSQMQACAAGQTYQGQDWNRTPHARNHMTPYRSSHGGQRHGFNQGFQQQGFQQQAFAGCGPGQQPLCDAQFGMICADTQALSGQNLALWNQGQNGFVRSGYSAYGQVQDQGYAGGGSAIGRTCQPGTLSCGPDAFCNPLMDQNIGVCTQ